MTRVYPLRVLLSLTLLAGLSWIWVDRVDELAYFLNPQPLQKLGNVISIQDFDAVADNSYVELSGVLGNKAAMLTGVRTGSFRWGPIQIQSLLGSPVFVEYDKTKYEKSFATFQEITAQGRLVSFGDRSELKRVREYLMQKLKSDFPKNARILIVDEKPYGDFRYPLLFLLSLIAVLSSFWSAFRGKTEENAL